MTKKLDQPSHRMLCSCCSSVTPTVLTQRSLTALRLWYAYIAFTVAVLMHTGTCAFVALAVLVHTGTCAFLALAVLVHTGTCAFVALAVLVHTGTCAFVALAVLVRTGTCTFVALAVLVHTGTCDMVKGLLSQFMDKYLCSTSQ